MCLHVEYVIVLANLHTCSTVNVCPSCQGDLCVVYKYRCLLEVHDRIGSLKASTEEESKEHENHELFKYEHDKQLLLWKQRYNFRTDM